MTTRLQVLLQDAEIAEIRRVAKAQRMSVAEWVRQALRRARMEDAYADPRPRLAAVREASAHSFPTGDIEQMNSEISRGYTTE